MSGKGSNRRPTNEAAYVFGWDRIFGGKNQVGSGVTVSTAISNIVGPGAGPGSPATLQEKIKSRVVVADSGCWEWQGAKYPQGYGAMKHEGKTQGVHRVAYIAFIGPIPDGKLVMHSCDNRICCNPKHLLAGTYSDNAADMHQKGRGHRHSQLPIPFGGEAVLRGDFSHGEAARALGVPLDQVKAWRWRLGIDRKHLGGGAESWRVRKEPKVVYVDDATGKMVDEDYWP